MSKDWPYSKLTKKASEHGGPEQYTVVQEEAEIAHEELLREYEELEEENQRLMEELAKVYGKDPAWVRAGIVSGWLPIGRATRAGKVVTSIEEMDSKLGRINYYISPQKLYEDTGFEWNGK